MAPSYLIIAAPTATTPTTTTEIPDRAALDAWIAAGGREVTGEVAQRGSIPLAPELLGQPRIRGLNGPMRERPGVVRYELPEPRPPAA